MKYPDNDQGDFSAAAPADKAAQTEPVAPSDGQIMGLVFKHFGNRAENERIKLIRTTWKDSIDIDEPSYALRRFVNDLLALAAPPSPTLASGSAQGDDIAKLVARLEDAAIRITSYENTYKHEPNYASIVMRNAAALLLREHAARLDAEEDRDAARFVSDENARLVTAAESALAKAQAERDEAREQAIKKCAALVNSSGKQMSRCPPDMQPNIADYLFDVRDAILALLADGGAHG